MGDIKINKLTLTFLVISSLLFFISPYISTSAIAEPAHLTMFDVSYYCYKSETSPLKFYYYINVSLYNSGNSSSVPIDIKIIEDDYVICPNHCRNVSIDVHELKTFTLDWCTNQDSKAIDIAYAPSDIETSKNEHNSGSQSIIMTNRNSNQGESTPGFEFLIILIATGILYLIMSFRRRK